MKGSRATADMSANTNKNAFYLKDGTTNQQWACGAVVARLLCRTLFSPPVPLGEKSVHGKTFTEKRKRVSKKQEAGGSNEKPNGFSEGGFLRYFLPFETGRGAIGNPPGSINLLSEYFREGQELPVPCVHGKAEPGAPVVRAFAKHLAPVVISIQVHVAP